MAVFITFRLFLVCLITCALLALIAIWTGPDTLAPSYFQITMSTFIVGLASFLVWFSLLFRAMHAKLTGSPAADQA